MADASPGGILGSFADMAMSKGVGGWISIGISFVVSTLVGGLILVALLKVLDAVWGEDYDIGRAFLVALVINALNLPFVNIIFSFLGFVPPMLLMAAIWILLIKVFFHEMPWPKAALTGIAGFALNYLVAPLIVGLVAGTVMSFIPL